MAGVCIGTVSRVINNKDKVHPDTRRRIQELIEQTGYRPSALGRNLVLRRTHNIMVELFNIADPYCATLVKRITALCRQHGYSTLAGDCDYDPAIEADYLRHALDGHLDGLIISPLPGGENVSLFRKLVDTRFPLVLMDNEVPGVKADCVRYDDFAGALLAIDYLFNAGHRTIAFCGWHVGFSTVQGRIAGYLEAHARRSLKPHPELILRTGNNPQQWDGMTALQELLRRNRALTAILAENDIMALACIHALQRLGRRVPDDIAVVSFGASSLAAYLPMPLTHVALREDEAVSQAVALLIERIEKPKQRKAPARQIIIKPELVIGRSA